MGTLTIKLNQLHTSTGVIGDITRLEIKGEKHIVLNGMEFDLRQLPDNTEWNSSGVADGSLAYMAVNSQGNTIFVATSIKDHGSTLSQETESIVDLTTLPNYAVWPQGEGKSPQAIKSQANNNYYPDTVYQRDQRVAIEAIEAWRRMKRVWMAQAAERADLASNLVEKVGKFLKSADAAIQIVFQDSSVSPETVAKIATEAAKGSLDITSVDEFMQSVHLNSTPPTTPMLWVTKVEPIRRVNLEDSISYSDRNIENHDTLEKGWLTKNQEGKIELSTNSPRVGTRLRATITDPDGDIRDIEYEWFCRQGVDSEWVVKSGASLDMLTIIPDDEGKQILSRIRYTDKANRNISNKNVATSEPTQSVLPAS